MARPKIILTEEESKKRHDESNSRNKLRVKVLNKLRARGLDEESALKNTLELVPYRMETSEISKKADMLVEQYLQNQKVKNTGFSD